MSDLLSRRWDIDDGLPTESFTDVLQTRDGFLWIASHEGLFRFDGLSFDVFDKRSIVELSAPEEFLELASDGFFRLAEDSVGSLWVAGSGGQILRYRHGSFSIFETGIAGPVHSLCIESTGSDERLWLGGRSPAYLDLGNEPPNRVAVAELRNVAIDAVACDGGTVWLGTDTGGLFVWRAGEIVGELVEDGHAIEALAVAHDRGVWIGSRAGLRKATDGVVAVLAELAGIGIYDILEDHSGDLWLATSQGLGRRRPSGDFEWLDGGTSGLREARAVEFDHEGSLWVAGRRGGLLRLKERQLASLTAHDGLRPGSVDALFETRRGDVLIGFDDYLADVGDDMRPRERSMPADLGAFDVLTMLEDRDGNLWLGGYLGLLRVDAEDGDFRRFSKESGFPSSEIRALHQDAAGVLWVGTGNRGVVRWDTDGAVEIFDRQSGWISDFVFAIEETPGGELLVAMRGGFHIRAPDGGLETYRAGRDFSGSNVFSVRPDREGHLWLTTDAGLVRFAGGRFDTFDRTSGLPTDVIFDLREDSQGWLWISSSKGIIRISKASLERFFADRGAHVEMTLFDEEDGMSNRQCSGARQILETDDGRLWFPTHDGVTIVDPLQLETNRQPPPVVVEHFLADGQEVPLSASIVLGPGIKRYEFDFAVLSYRDPAKNVVRYKLEGFAEQWQETVSRRQVAYTRLPPGDYVFRVNGANDDGIWSDSGTRLAFTVRPFFYQRPIFWVAIVAAVTLTIAAAVRWRLRRMRRRQLELEELGRIKDRLLEERGTLIAELQGSNEELERFTYTVSHDLKSPLVTIQGFLGFLRRDAVAGKTDRLVSDIDRIRAASEKMEELLEDLLELSRIGRIQESPEEIEMSELAIEALSQLAGPIAAAGADVTVAPSMPSVVGDRLRLRQVWQNLIENAIKYRDEDKPPRVEVGVLTRRQDDGADGSQGPMFYVRDDGRGIDPRHRDKIFGLFERLDPDGEGTGVGLALVKRIVEFHGGHVWVESDGEGHGSTFYFTLEDEPTLA